MRAEYIFFISEAGVDVLSSTLNSTEANAMNAAQCASAIPSLPRAAELDSNPLQIKTHWHQYVSRPTKPKGNTSGSLPTHNLINSMHEPSHSQCRENLDIRNLSHWPQLDPYPITISPIVCMNIKILNDVTISRRCASAITNLPRAVKHDSKLLKIKTHWYQSTSRQTKQIERQCVWIPTYPQSHQ